MKRRIAINPMSIKTLKWVPVIDEERCTGCNHCVEACGPKSLEVRNGVAMLARPDTCGRSGSRSRSISRAWVSI